MDIILIPARGGSKRIPGKNLKPLSGKPLLMWTIEMAKELDMRVVVSTDDQDTVGLTLAAGGVAVHERSPFAATDTATDADVVFDFLNSIADYRLYDLPPDTIIYLRPTTPFRSVKVLREIIDHQLPVNFSSIRSVQESPESALKMFLRGGFGDLVPIRGSLGEIYSDQPNQLCPKTYQANGYIDILFPKRQFFRRDNIFGPNIYGYETPPTIELDTLEQWDYAEYLIAKGLV